MHLEVAFLLHSTTTKYFQSSHNLPKPRHMALTNEKVETFTGHPVRVGVIHWQWSLYS
jgi:hypothetical protein